MKNREISLKEKEDPDKEILLWSRMKTVLMITLYFSISFLTAMEQGIFPCSVEPIFEHYAIQLNEYVLLLSFFYIGKILGFILHILFPKFSNQKYILIITLLLNSIFLCLFINSDSNNFQINMLRMFIGITQIFQVTYLPKWINCIYNSKLKLLISIMSQLAIPLGMAFGCVISHFYYWTIGISIEMFGSFSVAMIIYIIFNRKDLQFKRLLGVNQFTFSTSNISFENQNDSKISKKEKSLNISKIKLVFAKIHIMFLMIARTFLTFTLTSIHIWYYYFLYSAELFTKKALLFSYIIVSIIMTALGGFFGEMIVKRTETMKFQISRIISYSIVLSSIPLIISFILKSTGLDTNSLMKYNCLISIYILISSSIIPIISKMIFTSIPNPQSRHYVNIFSTLFTIIFGHLPAVYFYGKLEDLIWCLRLSVGSSVSLVLCLICLSSVDDVEKIQVLMKNKKSSLFTTSIEGIYGNNYEYENEPDEICGNLTVKEDDIITPNEFNSFVSNNSSTMMLEMLTGNQNFNNEQNIESPFNSYEECN